MSTFDPSRTPYVHWRCGTLPCTCVRAHQPLTVIELSCWESSCPQIFSTMTELSEHHFLCHEVAHERC